MKTRQEAIDKGYMKRKNSKAIAKEVVDEVMEKYPNLMERLRLEEEKDLKHGKTK